MLIIWSRFTGMKLQPSSRDGFHPTVTWRNQFSSRLSGTSFHLVLVYKILQIPIYLKMFPKWWNSVKTLFTFFSQITSYTSWKDNRNNYDLLKCTFFQTDVLINFFIPLRRAEAITWENFVSAKRDPGSTNKGSRLAGMKLSTGSRNI